MSTMLGFLSTLSGNVVKMHRSMQLGGLIVCGVSDIEK